MSIKCSFAICIVGVFSTFALAQEHAGERISIQFENASVPDALQQLSEQSSFNIAFSPDFFDESRRLNVTFSAKLIGEILAHIIGDAPVEFRFRHDQIIIRKKQIIPVFQISGFVMDSLSNDKLAYASVYCPELGIGVSTNDFGYYQIKLPKGMHSLQYGYVGMQKSVKKVVVSRSQKINVELNGVGSGVEVLVTPKIVQGSAAMHRMYQQKKLTDLSLNTPSVSGESDVLQTVRSLPGIQSNAGEVGGYFVRGGGNDQNLVLMDGVPLYYPSHMLGIYSVFNSEAVRSIQVFKSGFPARYGGRLSSVIDIHTRAGNTEHWQGEIAGSFQSLRASVQGPISKRGSIMVGGRRSIVAPFINEVIGASFFRVSGDNVFTEYHDLHLKLNHEIGQKDRLLLNYYTGRDDIELEEVEAEESLELSSRNKWSNSVLSMRYQRELGRSSFLNITQSLNYFNSEFLQLQEFDDFFEEELGEYLFRAAVSNNIDIETKFEIDHYISSNTTAKYGGGMTRHSYTPSLEEQNDDGFNPSDSNLIDFNFFTVTKEGTFEVLSSHLYSEFESKWSEKIFTNLGLRLTAFKNEDNTYKSLEPRINLKYLFTDRLAVNLSSSKMVQYLHQISNSELAFPKDIWLPSGDFLQPSHAWHYNLGVRSSIGKESVLTLEAYFKEMNNIAFVFSLEGISLTDASFLENASIGRGSSYGLEGILEVPFKGGHWTSSATWSKSDRNFIGINEEISYPFQFDRRFEFKSLISFSPTSNLTLSSRFYAATGSPDFLVENSSVYFDLTPLDLSNGPYKNTQRGKSQFRLDLSASFKFKSHRLAHSVKLNLYNVLNIKNSGFSYLDHLATRFGREDVLPCPSSPPYNTVFLFRSVFRSIDALHISEIRGTSVPIFCTQSHAMISGRCVAHRLAFMLVSGGLAFWVSNK